MLQPSTNFMFDNHFHLQAHFLVSLCKPQLEQSLRFEEIIKLLCDVLHATISILLKLFGNTLVGQQ
jgi:hypothetical protein